MHLENTVVLLCLPFFMSSMNVYRLMLRNESLDKTSPFLWISFVNFGLHELSMKGQKIGSCKNIFICALKNVTYPQTIQDVSEFVSSSERIW